jgi:hypothetical protein
VQRVFVEQLPGLNEWSPKAAAELIKDLHLYEKANEQWYADRRKGLGLPGKREYRVRSFHYDRDGRPDVDLR